MKKPGQSLNYLSDILGKPISQIKADWQSISFEENCIPQGKQPEICVNKHMIGINVGQLVNVDSKVDGKRIKFPFLRGSLMLLPAEVPINAHLDKVHNSISFNLTQELLSRNAMEMWDDDRVELIPSFPIHDPLINQMAEALRRNEKTNADGCQIYAKTMANALAVHLLQNFSTRSHTALPRTEALASKKLKRVLDYINDHLEQKIEIEELATLAQLSQYHFSRVFKESTGLSPHQYVIQQRVEKAKQLLSQRTMTISEVALASGFTHQSHLNRHFKGLLNITPKEFLNQ